MGPLSPAAGPVRNAPTPSAQPSSAVQRDLFRILVEGVRDYAIFMLDPGGRVVSWNPGAERIKGYRVEEIMGRSFALFYLPEERARGKPDRDLAEAATHGSCRDEGLRVRQDGSIFWADTVLTALRDERGALLGFAKVTRDITERRRAARQERRLELTEEAVRERDEFLALAAHELRTPVTALRLQIQALRRSSEHRADAGPDAGRDGAPPAARPAPERLVGALERQVARLSLLVDDLLLVAERDARDLPLRREPVELAEVVREAVRRVELTARQAGCELRLELEEGVRGSWDRGRLVRAVGGLLDNAVKYGRGKAVEVQLETAGGRARLRVRDQGIGIPLERQGALFERFGRGVSVRHYGGFGLGLWIVRRTAEAHGGRVSLESAPGLGATFVLELPLA